MLEKIITDNIIKIQDQIRNINWLKDKIYETDNLNPNTRFNLTISLETKIILQQCKIYIIEQFWHYFHNRINITTENLIYYSDGRIFYPIDILNFSNSKNINVLLKTFPIIHNISDNENYTDFTLNLANKYWLDLIEKEIYLFNIHILAKNDSLKLINELYIKLELYYLPENERESWTRNLQQEFAPLFRIYLRGINYDFNLINREGINEFIDSLYKCLRYEAANNTNNFIFSDTDFEDFSSKCPIKIKDESVPAIKLLQNNKWYDTTILGCPAVFSKVSNRYMYSKLLKDLFYWQMDLYKEILISIKNNENLSHTYTR